MRRLALVLVVTLASATSSGAASAASPDGPPVRSQFYIFEGSSFESGAKTPGIDLMNPRQAARFGRLMSLKKDLLAGMGKTLKERSLK